MRTIHYASRLTSVNIAEFLINQKTSFSQDYFQITAVAPNDSANSMQASLSYQGKEYSIVFTDVFLAIWSDKKDLIAYFDLFWIDYMRNIFGKEYEDFFSTVYRINADIIAYELLLKEQSKN